MFPFLNRNKKESLKPLSEKDIQSKLYGHSQAAPVAGSNFAAGKARKINDIQAEVIKPDVSAAMPQVESPAPEDDQVAAETIQLPKIPKETEESVEFQAAAEIEDELEQEEQEQTVLAEEAVVEAMSKDSEGEDESPVDEKASETDDDERDDDGQFISELFEPPTEGAETDTDEDAETGELSDEDGEDDAAESLEEENAADLSLPPGSVILSAGSAASEEKEEADDVLAENEEDEEELAQADEVLAEAEEEAEDDEAEVAQADEVLAEAEEEAEDDEAEVAQADEVLAEAEEEEAEDDEAEVAQADEVLAEAEEEEAEDDEAEVAQTDEVLAEAEEEAEEDEADVEQADEVLAEAEEEDEEEDVEEADEVLADADEQELFAPEEVTSESHEPVHASAAVSFDTDHASQAGTIGLKTPSWTRIAVSIVDVFSEVFGVVMAVFRRLPYRLIGLVLMGALLVFFAIQLVNFASSIPERIAARNSAQGKVTAVSADRKANVAEVELSSSVADAVPAAAKPAEPTSVIPKKFYGIQIVTYKSEGITNRMLEKLQGQGLDAWSKVSKVRGYNYYEVFIGHFATLEDASAKHRRLKKLDVMKDFADSYVRVLVK